MYMSSWVGESTLNLMTWWRTYLMAYSASNEAPFTSSRISQISSWNKVVQTDHYMYREFRFVQSWVYTNWGNVTHWSIDDVTHPLIDEHRKWLPHVFLDTIEGERRFVSDDMNAFRDLLTHWNTSYNVYVEEQDRQLFYPGLLYCWQWWADVSANLVLFLIPTQDWLNRETSGSLQSEKTKIGIVCVLLNLRLVIDVGFGVVYRPCKKLV